MTDDPIRHALRDFILDNFLPGEPADSLRDSDSLISGGIIPSLSLVELVNFIEDHFSINLDEEDISARKMNSIDLLTELVKKRQKG